MARLRRIKPRSPLPQVYLGEGDSSLHRSPDASQVWAALMLDAPANINVELANTWYGPFFTEWGPTAGGIQMVREFDYFLSGTIALPLWLQAVGFQEDAENVRWVRQALRLWWKVDTGELPNDAETRLSAARRIAMSGRHDPNSEYVFRARRHIKQLLSELPIPCGSMLTCKHGKGSVAEGSLSLREKLGTFTLFRTMLPFFDSSDIVDLPFWHDQDVLIKFENRGITRMVSVPKDARGPRIISEEPCSLMWLQQGMMGYLQPVLERRTEMAFSDQLSHRKLLLDRTYSSLDLKDASDMVSRRLVWNLFPPGWRELLFSLRSNFIQDDETKILYPIRAFAPMGSALCFVIESVVHWAAVKAAQEDLHKRDRKPFSVYGDDIIVHSNIAGSVLSALRSMGLQPNDSKCFINRRFRESCGLDVFDNVDVTPTYLRYPWRSVSNERVACSFAQNQVNLASKGFAHLASYIRRSINRYHTGFPSHDTLVERPYCWLFGPSRFTTVWDQDEQRERIRARHLVPVMSEGTLEGLAAYTAILGSTYQSHFSIERPNRFKVQWRWSRTI